MKKLSLHEIMKILTAFCCLLLIGTMTVSNAAMFTEPARKYLSGETDFSAMTKVISEGYVSDQLQHRYTFIEANGLGTRISGLRFVNDVRLMKNGMLTYGKLPDYPTEMVFAATNLKELSDYLDTMGSHLIYAAIPYKSDIVADLIPTGMMDDIPRIRGDNLLRELSERNIDVLDMRDALAGTEERINKYYYRTDHHWNSLGAFEGFRMLMEQLHSLDPTIDMTYTDLNLWEFHSKANWFLGSHGQRVGTLYAGIDDLIWYTPRFETEMSCIIPKYRFISKGDYAKAELRQRFIDNSYLFTDSNYDLHTGGSFPLVQHRNAQAPNKKRIVLVKESFGVPLQTYFATAFTEVDVFDLRLDVPVSLSDYCAWTKPDYVIYATLPATMLRSSYSVVGVEEAKKTQLNPTWETVLESTDIYMPVQYVAYHPSMVCDMLEPGGVYRVSFDSITMSQGASDAVNICLYDVTDRKWIAETIYDIGFCNQNGVEPWTFRVPAESHWYRLLTYAGLIGDDSGNDALYSGVKVEKQVSVSQ